MKRSFAQEKRTYVTRAKGREDINTGLKQSGAFLSISVQESPTNAGPSEGMEITASKIISVVGPQHQQMAGVAFAGVYLERWDEKVGKTHR